MSAPAVPSQAGPARQPQAAAPLELRLSLVDAHGAGADVVVSATSTHTVGELAAAAAQLLDAATAAAGLWCERRRQRLDATLALGDAGILWGDRLLLGAAPAEPTLAGGAAEVEAVVVGGPCSGRRIAFGPGQFLVGRGAECEVALPDPSLSRSHLLVRVAGSTVQVADAESANGTAVDGVGLRTGEWRLLGSEDHVEIGRTMLRFERLPPGGPASAGARAGRLAFNRPPRVARPLAPMRAELAPPPERARRVRLPLAMCLVPLVLGVVMWLVLDSPAMLAFSLLMPVMAIVTFVTDRRSGRSAYRQDAERFRARIVELQDELQGAAEQERGHRRISAPDAAELAARATQLAPDLWERRPEDGDFLALRVGIADLPATAHVALPKTGDEDLRGEAERAFQDRRVLASVPLMLDARGAGAIGICGARERIEALARWLVVQAATLHSPSDLVVCSAVAHRAAETWQWLKWLPHAHPTRVLVADGGVLVIGDIEARRLLRDVRELQASRVADREARFGGRGATNNPHVLVVLDEDLGIDRSLVDEVLAEATETGVTIAWLGRDRRDLPGRCGAILELGADRATLAATIVASGHADHEVSADGVEPMLAELVARALAPVRDVSTTGRAAEIPRRAATLDLLGLSPPRAEEIAARWHKRDGRLTATLGAGAGTPLTLDLRADGPHALIVGTTGSGKSELLRTLVASMAAAHPPDRLSFLLVDYKGGAAFAPCAGFPHVVDVVSDLDEHVAQRALISLEAELRRREAILAATRAKDLVELERRDPGATPPALVIMVDEFARLRDEVPDFVDGVVDIAQRGRSLGVHMILAAQSVRTAFTAAIKSNTNIRVALRVAEDGDSEDVIAARHAARIPSGEAFRGRGYARTGHGELTEFQAGYASGRSVVSERVDMTLAPFELGTGVTGPADERYLPAPDTDTDLTALALATSEACATVGIAEPARPWLPLLPATLALDRLPAARTPAIGLIDDPRRQRQLPLELDLARTGNVVAFGAGRSGKSTFLRTVALAHARAASPSELQLYALESPARGLQTLMQLPHCGAVVTTGEGERVERLLALLTLTVEERARTLAAAHAATIDELDGARPPRIVLLLDDLGAFVNEYDGPSASSPYEQLCRLMASGRAAGVHVVATADRRSALSSVLSPHVGRRLVLRMATDDDMMGLGLDARTVRGVKLEPGRGFTLDGLEFQLAGPTPDEDQLAQLARVAAELQARHPAPEVAGVETLSDSVARAQLPPCAGRAWVPLGLGGSALAAVGVDLTELHMMVIGPYRSGRTTALKTLVAGLAGAPDRPRLALLSPRRSRLLELDVWERAGRGAAGCAELSFELLAEVEGRSPEDPGTPLVVVVDDAGELADMAVGARMERIVRLGRDVDVRVVAAVETMAARGIGVPWLRELRKEGHGLLLRPDLPGDGDLLGAELPRRARGPFPPGRGFVVHGGRHTLIHVAE